MEAKTKMIFGRQKNRILRPQEQIADEVRRSVRVRGKENKDGGKAFELGNWSLILEAGCRGRHLRRKRINVRHARLSLREAADVLRTDRRTRGEEKAAQVNANDGGMRPLTQHVNQTMYVT